MSKKTLLGLVVAVLVLALVPLVVADGYWRHLFIIAFVYAIIASNWNLSLGHTGIFNFGHLTFFGIGVYTAAIASKTLGISPWIAIGLAGITAALSALLMAAPVARLKGIYVVLVTFAVNQLMIQLVLSQANITGGGDGMVRLPYLSIGDYSFLKDYKLGYYYVALFLLVLSSLFLIAVTSSPFGKSLKAVRDAEDYATARGISVARQRIVVLILSAIFTGIAGGFYTIYLRVASPEVFGFGTMSLALSMVLIGGVNSVLGPVAAALVLTFATEAMASIQGFDDARYIIIAVAMILVLRLAPGGLVQLAERLVTQSRPARRPDAEPRKANP
jgi:branched-chain amino acid transport system permease protein